MMTLAMRVVSVHMDYSKVHNYMNEYECLTVLYVCINHCTHPHYHRRWTDNVHLIQVTVTHGVHHVGETAVHSNLIPWASGSSLL